MSERHNIPVPAAVPVQLLLSALLCLLCASAPARADLILTIGSGSVDAGGTTNVEVSLLNTGAAVQIDSFYIEISTANSYLSFNDATIDTTDAYIFAGNSAFAVGDSILANISSGPPTIFAGDQQASAYDTTPSWSYLQPNTTAGLAELSITISPDAPVGSQALLAFTSIDLGTSLSDPIGTDLTPSNPANFVGGVLMIVPEPSTAGFLAFGIVLVWRRVARASSSSGSPGQ